MRAAFNAFDVARRSPNMPFSILCGASVLVLFVIECRFVAQHQNFMGDFKAPYLSSRAVLLGLNPYVTSAAPLPGYVLALYAPFALAAYPAASAMWLFILVMASAADVVLLARMLDRPIPGVIALLGLGLAFAPLPIGAIPPLALAAFILAAMQLRNGRVWIVAALLALSAVLPHLALPAMASVFLYERRARIPLACAAGLLALVDVAYGGWTVALDYVTRILPGAAGAEAGYVMQYSLTWLAQAAGASQEAILLGRLSYALMLGLGLWCAVRLSRRYGDRAFLVLIPPGFAVIGGSYIHFADILLALPAVCLLWKNSAGKSRSVLTAAIVLIAFPWLWITQEWFAFCFAAAAIVMGVWLFGLTLRASLGIGLLTMTVCVALLALGSLYGPQLPVTPEAHPMHPIVSQNDWAHLVRSSLSSGGVFWIAVKVPTWIGLLFFLGCSLVKAWGRPEPSPERVPA